MISGADIGYVGGNKIRRWYSPIMRSDQLICTRPSVLLLRHPSDCEHGLDEEMNMIRLEQGV